MFYVNFRGLNSGSYYSASFKDFNEAVRFKQCFDVYVLLGYGSYYNIKVSKKRCKNYVNYYRNQINNVYDKMIKAQRVGYI